MRMHQSPGETGADIAVAYNTAVCASLGGIACLTGEKLFGDAGNSWFSINKYAHSLFVPEYRVRWALRTG